MKNFLIFIFTLCFATLANATPSSDLTKLLQNMQSIQANFVQTILDKNGQAMQESTGQMWLKRPNQFRWDVKNPTKQLIIANGKRLWVYDPDLDQVTIRTISKAAGETPAMLLSETHLSLDKEFVVKPVASHSSNSQWFLLIPKDKSAVIASLKLGFANQQIQQMQIEDHLGHTTKIKFNNTKINAPIAVSFFNFKPPKGVDLIDETKR